MYHLNYRIGSNVSLKIEHNLWSLKSQKKDSYTLYHQVKFFLPILFLQCNLQMYYYDLPEYLKLEHQIIYRTQTIIYKKTMHSQKYCLHVDLYDVIEAASKWEEVFHVDKCNFLLITTKHKPEHFYYNLHNHFLESFKHHKPNQTILLVHVQMYKRINRRVFHFFSQIFSIKFTILEI